MTDNDIHVLQEYYQSRAPEYEAIYNFVEPGRREELNAIEALARETFKEKSTLEIACGSGYWTEILSGASVSILALDGSSAMLEIARTRNYAKANVAFKQFDAYNLSALTERYDSALAGFWLSHVPKRRLQTFLSGLQSCLKSGAPVLLLDNNLVEGMGGTVIENSSFGDTEDTFKERTLSDGSKHAIIKNYFTTEELQNLLSPYATNIKITMGKWYWSALYLSK